MTIERKNRWSLAFADLSLLMIGCLVLMINTPFSSADTEKPVQGVENGKLSIILRSGDLFENNEAMITNRGKAIIAEFVARNKDSGQHIELSLNGSDAGSARLDSWELAAARLAAVSRVMSAKGITRDAIKIGLIDQSNIIGEQEITVRILNDG